MKGNILSTLTQTKAFTTVLDLKILRKLDEPPKVWHIHGARTRRAIVSRCRWRGKSAPVPNKVKILRRETHRKKGLEKISSAKA